MVNNRALGIVALLAVGAWIASSSLYVVTEKQRAIKLRFGEVVQADIEPGNHIPCECGLVFIGETGHNLSLHQKEHITNCELEKSAVAKHTWTYAHRIKWNEVTILAVDNHNYSCKMKESIEIEKHSTIVQEGKPLDNTWHALFHI